MISAVRSITSAMSAALRKLIPATSRPWFLSSTAWQSCAARPTASANSVVPGMMKGKRGISPMKAASVEIGRKGRSVLARIVALAAWQWMTALARGRARYMAMCTMLSLEGLPPSPIFFPFMPILTMISGSRLPLNMALGVIHIASSPGTRTLTFPPVAVMSSIR